MALFERGRMFKPLTPPNFPHVPEIVPA